MKKQLFIFSSILCISLAACKQKQEETSTLENSSKMKVTNIYRKDSVLAFIGLYGNTNQSLAEQYVQKGENALNTDLKKSTYCFKRALTLFPDENIYRRFGDALFEKGKYEDAHEVYHTLIDLNKAQTEDEYLKIIKNELLAANDYSAYSLVDNFKSQNYPYESIQKNILADATIMEKLPPMKLKDFSRSVNDIWGIAGTDENTETSEGASFPDYLKKFKPVTLPFNAGVKELQKFLYRSDDNDNEYMEYNPANDFSRFMEHSIVKSKYYAVTDFQYFIKDDKGLIVLVQAADTSAEAVPADFRCTFHRLLVYNSKGDLYDSQIIGSHTGEILTTYTIDNGLLITSENFVRKWKKPFKRYEIDNEIISTEKTGETQYRITELGKIVEIQQP